MAYLLLGILALFVTTVVSGYSQNRPYHIGFMGTRGKRSTNEESNSNDLKTTGALVEGTNENIPQNYISNLAELTVLKRAPTGFMGMRGKKDFEYSGYDSRSTDSLESSRENERIPFNRIEMNLNPKRVPSGFMGMRGKKLELLLDNKRGPLGFYGTRGKKDTEYSDDDDYEQEQGIDNSLLYTTEFLSNADDSDLIKRAPAVSGFFGMRGKKFYSNEMGYENEKRAPTGFLGMRGKKDLNSMNADKRSYLAQFFGIRGKKQPFNSGFFGMRGKKQPFQFRGKFVGVRGKKSSVEPLASQLESQLYDISEDNGREMMQGKKLSDESISEN